MRKFLLALCFSLLSLGAAAADLPAIAGLKAFRQPMDEIVREAGKGRDADFAVVGKSYASAAWAARAGRQEETWRQVRTLGMLMGYLEEAIRRGDRTLMLRSAAMLPPAYEKLAAALGMR